jgi:chromosome segregation ATPase
MMSDLQDLQDSIEELKEKKILYKGKLDSLMEVLKRDYKDVKTAKIELSKMKEELEKRKALFAEKEKLFREKYSDILEEI